jgi:predicted RNase H-like nuclease
MLDIGRTVAGVDGCKAGWVAVTRRPGGPAAVTVFATIADLVDALPPDAVIAVDMPMGLPERIMHGGRGPEALVRPLIGMRRSSVFSIPSRKAVYAEPGPFAAPEEWYAAHRRTCVMARATSEPPRGVSIQAFGIFSKIREVDTLLRARRHLATRVIESHPEVAFWRLNGGLAMSLPKKVKGRVNPAGIEERKALLARCGFARGFLDRAPPRGAAEDDLLDAAAVMLTAVRFALGQARPFPDPRPADGHGIPIAIWA